MPIDEDDAPKGFIAVKATIQLGCLDCYFQADLEQAACPKFPTGRVMCLAKNRADGRYVIFIKRKEPTNG